MKRWQTTYLGKPFLIYANSEEDVRREHSSLIDEGTDVVSYEDMTYMNYINEIKNRCEFIREEKRRHNNIREVYKCDCFCGTVFVRLVRDASDNVYYECIDYQVWEYGYMIAPITWTFCLVHQFCETILNVNALKYVVYAYRLYGQPKLDKPKELKGIKSIGNAMFNTHVNPQIFISGKDVWIRHNDYFSSSWRPPKGERIDMPTSYYLKKYFNIDRPEKFIYADCWGDIVLRNEAWIKLENLVSLCRYKEMNYTQIARKIIQQQRLVERGMSSGVCDEWERFWENVVKVVREKINAR